MQLKKIICLALSSVLGASLIACGNGNGDPETKDVHVYMPDGAPAIALASLMNSGYDRADFTVVPASDIGAQVSTGAADMAMMPINAAATLYNKGVQIVMLTVNTHGNLFVVGGEEIDGLDGLKGKRLGVIGEANVPDLTLKMLADELDVELEKSETATDGKIVVRYAADGGALMPLLKTGAVDYALLAEPAVTTAVGATGKQVVMDMQELWKNTFDGEYPQACLVAKKSLVQNDKSYVDGFIAALKSSDGWAEDNADKAVEVIGEHMKSGTVSTLTTLNKSIVERCNIRTVSAQSAKTDCAAFFAKLTHIQTAIGTALDKAPDDGFYYNA